jgi:hypothetical protein
VREMVKVHRERGGERERTCAHSIARSLSYAHALSLSVGADGAVGGRVAQGVGGGAAQAHERSRG